MSEGECSRKKIREIMVSKMMVSKGLWAALKELGFYFE